MTKYSITYQRKVQVRPYEMLTIGLTEEFDSEETHWDDAFNLLRTQVSDWIDEERDRLGAS